MSALFLFASLGVINGILLGLYLLTKKERSAADGYFAGLLLALCIRIGKSVLVYFNPETDRLILQIGLSACLFIGPFFYLYSKFINRKNDGVRSKDILLLTSLLLSILSLGLIWPYSSFPDVWNSYMVKGIYMVWALFLIVGLYHGRATLIKALSEPKSLDSRERYVLGIALSTIFITLTYQFALFIEGVTYIWGSLIFSVSFYYLAARKLIERKPIVPKPASPPPLSDGDQLFKKVEDHMINKKPFTNPRLKLDELARDLGMSRHQLSRILNEVYALGFSHYIKTHRVNEAKELIRSRHELSLEGIGYEAGFNSKSAFFEAFKKITGQTPSAFKKASDAPNELVITPD